MKHVTIQPPSPDRAGPVAPTDDPSSHNDLTVPVHMIPSGEDGYRTPTGEDFDLASRQPYSKRREDYFLPGATPIPPPAVNGHSNGTPNGVLGHHSATASTASLGERLFEALFWRERIRHFTWTFFTLTMATGGIANVIYTGKRPNARAGEQRLIVCFHLSPLSFPWALRDWCYVLPVESDPLHHECLHYLSAILHAP